MVLIGANYTAATFPARRWKASVNVKAVIRAAFLRLRARNSVVGDGGSDGGDGGGGSAGRVQGFRGENGTVIPGRNWIDGFLT